MDLSYVKIRPITPTNAFQVYHTHPASDIFPIVIPLSIFAWAVLRFDALIGTKVSVNVERNFPASIKAATSLSDGFHTEDATS